jgi:hypothetical protein
VYIYNVYVDLVKLGIWNNLEGQFGNFRIDRSYVRNCWQSGMNFDGTSNYVHDAYVLSNFSNASMDYYISIHGGEQGTGTGHSNSVRNSYIFRDVDDSHTGHGIAIKAKKVDWSLEYGLYENVEIVNMKNGAIEFRHSGTKYNVCRNIYIHNTEDSHYASFSGLNFENGCSYNIVENSLVDGCYYGSNFTVNDEDVSVYQPGGTYNTVRNTTYKNCFYVFGSNSGEDPNIPGDTQAKNIYNKWEGCLFLNNERMFVATKQSGTTNTPDRPDPEVNFFDDTVEFLNCIFANIQTENYPGNYGTDCTPTYNYDDFFSSKSSDWSYNPMPGDGNINIDPELNNKDQSQNKNLKAGIKIIGNEYDAYNRQKESIPTIGNFEILKFYEVILKWKNSTSHGVSKTEIYRDNLNVGELDVKYPSIYYDNVAELGVTYKYTVQAVGPNGESIDEDPNANVKILTTPSG